MAVFLHLTDGQAWASGQGAGQTLRMGFDPTRKQVRRRSDYLMVMVALLVCAALVAWAFLG